MYISTNAFMYIQTQKDMAMHKCCYFVPCLACISNTTQVDFKIWSSLLAFSRCWPKEQKANENMREEE